MNVKNVTSLSAGEIPNTFFVNKPTNIGYIYVVYS